MFAKAPVLAWLLTALTCALAGLVANEVRSQQAAPPIPPAAIVVVTVEVVIPSMARRETTPVATSTPVPGPCDPSTPGTSPFCTGNAR